jgi:acetyl esterase/lipase
MLNVMPRLISGLLAALAVATIQVAPASADGVGLPPPVPTPPLPVAVAGGTLVPALGTEQGTVLLFHSGGWLGGSEQSEVGLAQLFSLHGWRAISVAYPLHDVPGAYRAASEAATTWRSPGKPLVAVGESAGGAIAEWLAARRRVDAAAAVGAPADFRTWRLIQPHAPWSSWPASVGIRGQLWRWSPARVYDAQRSAPLFVYHSLDDRVVEPAQARTMRARGAQLHWLHGDHLTDTSWQADALARLGAVTRP